MKKFWVVHNIPSPYRLHIFNALWKECMKRGLDFHVHFMSDMSRGYDERPVSWRNPKMDFPHTYWRDWGWGQRHVNPGLLWHLRKHQPDYLLAGSPFDTLTGMFAGRMTNGVTCTWCEGNARRPGRLDGLLGRIKRFALVGFDFVAVPGVQGRRYVELHSARTDRKMPICITLPNLIDETLFNAQDTEMQCGNNNDEAACKWRRKFGCLSHTKLCIVPSRFDPVKGVIEFLRCLNTEMLNDWKIVIAGDGPLRSEGERIIRERGLAGRVVINGFVSYNEMPALYAAADLMLLPSLQDQNPLAVVEALHSGLPIAESDQAGNVDEAVTEGKNGWVLPVKDKKMFSAVLADVFSTPLERLREMGKWSKFNNAQYWNTGRAIKGFMDELL